MSEHEQRKFMLMNELITLYKNGALPLNSFIDKFDAVLVTLENKRFSVSAAEALVDIEQVNAAMLVKKRELTEEESIFVFGKLEDLSEILKNI